MKECKCLEGQICPYCFKEKERQQLLKDLQAVPSGAERAPAIVRLLLEYINDDEVVEAAL